MSQPAQHLQANAADMDWTMSHMADDDDAASRGDEDDEEEDEEDDLEQAGDRFDVEFAGLEDELVDEVDSTDDVGVQAALGHLDPATVRELMAQAQAQAQGFATDDAGATARRAGEPPRGEAGHAASVDGADEGASEVHESEWGDGGAGTAAAQANPSEQNEAALARRIGSVVSDLLMQQIESRMQSTRKERQKESPAVVVQSTDKDVFISFCSHAMHMECLQNYLDLMKREQAATGSLRRQVADFERNEFFCPMCKSLSNIIVPFVQAPRGDVAEAARRPGDERKGAPADADGAADFAAEDLDAQASGPSKSQAFLVPDKRRRLSSATPDEMARFITGELGELTPELELGELTTRDIERLADTILAVADPEFPLTDIAGSQASGAEAGQVGYGGRGRVWRIGVGGGGGGNARPGASPQASSAPSFLASRSSSSAAAARLAEEKTALRLEKRVLALWRSLAFSMSAREGISHPNCGVPSVTTGFRELRELLKPSHKQWWAMFRAAEIVSREWARRSAGVSSGASASGSVSSSPVRTVSNPASAVAASAASAATLASKLLRPSVIGRRASDGASSTSASATTGASAGEATEATEALAPDDDAAGAAESASVKPSRAQASTFGSSMLRSGLSTFLNTFRKSARAIGQRGGAGVDGATAGDNDSVSERGQDANVLVQMLTTGICRDRDSALAAELAPGVRATFPVALDEDLVKHAEGPHNIVQAARVCLDKSGRPVQVLPGDEVVYVSRQTGTMTVERLVTPHGTLLNMRDPVALLAGLLCTTPASMHLSATRAMAMATLVQALERPDSVDLCEHASNSPRIALARQWAVPLRQLKPGVSDQVVFQALFGRLARFLRSAAMMLIVIQGEDEVSRSTERLVELDEYGDLDEVEALWSRFLGLPSVDEMVQSDTLMEIIQGWKAASIDAQAGFTTDRCCLDRTRLGLIGLPSNYEQLLAHIARVAKCPTTGKPIKSPALCLRCGAVVCAQQTCCKRRSSSGRDLGAGTQHAQACGGGSCAFLLVQKCVVVLVHGNHAVDLSAPYVDSHGETDDYLRRGRPLKFHEQAYRNLQYICANNEICHRVASIAQNEEHQRGFRRHRPRDAF